MRLSGGSFAASDVPEQERHRSWRSWYLRCLTRETDPTEAKCTALTLRALICYDFEMVVLHSDLGITWNWSIRCQSLKRQRFSFLPLQLEATESERQTMASFLATGKSEACHRCYSGKLHDVQVLHAWFGAPPSRCRTCCMPGFMVPGHWRSEVHVGSVPWLEWSGTNILSLALLQPLNGLAVKMLLFDPWILTLD